MNHSKTNLRFVHFADNTIKFDIESPHLLAVVDAHFAHCFGGNENIVAEYQIRMMKDTASSGDSLFFISKDGDEIFSKLSFEQVLFHLMQDGLTQLNGASATQLIFHTAALAHQDSGLLLCGKSGSGKSTLAAQLVANGFQYLTDEVVSLPVTGEEISGFCRSLVLKKGSAFIWQKLLKDSKPNELLEFKDGNAWVTPTLFNSAAVQSEAMPRIIIFPTYNAESDFQIQRLTSANTLFRLMQTLVNARNFSDHGLAATTQLASRVVAYGLTYSNVVTAAQWIQETISAI